MPAGPKKHRDMGFEYHYNIGVAVAAAACTEDNYLMLDVLFEMMDRGEIDICQ